MKNDPTTAILARIPACDFCGQDAAYDTRTRMGGVWAYACQPCWERYGVGQLGTGHGQRLILAEDVG